MRSKPSFQNSCTNGTGIYKNNENVSNKTNSEKNTNYFTGCLEKRFKNKAGKNKQGIFRTNLPPSLYIRFTSFYYLPLEGL